MGQRVQFRDTDSGKSVWVHRINKLMEEKKVTQQELAERCELSSSVVSDWIGLNKRKGQELREPKILGFQKIAKCLGVSVDYLLGDNVCETPDDERIHEKIGLSGLAIKNLKTASEKAVQDTTAEKEIAALSYLIETMFDGPFLEDLYNYLLGNFSFPGKEEAMGAAYMEEHLSSGRKKRNITFKDVFSQATFVDVQSDLMDLKRKVNERKGGLE